MFSDEEIRRLFHAIDTQPLSEMSNRALVDPVLFRVLYATGLRLSEALNLQLRDLDPARATLEVRDSKNREHRIVPVTRRLADTLEAYIAAAHPDPEPAHHLFHTGDPARPADKSTIYNRLRRYLADADIPHFPGRPAHPFAASRVRRAEPAPLGGRRQRPGGDAALPVGVHGPRRPARNPVLPPVDRGRVPRGRRDGPSQVRVRHPGPGRAGRSRAVSRVTPAGGDLAGRWLSKFLTDHLAGERDLSPQTIASYRDAIKLLLTWFRDVQATPPEKLRLADLDRARVLAFLDWLEAERGNSPATRNQRLAVIKSFARYTAIERPEFLDQATQIIAVKQKKTPATDMGYLTGDEVKALLAATRPGHPARTARHRPALHALRHRRPRPRDLRPEHRRRPRGPPDARHAARQRLQNQARPADGPHRPTPAGLPRPAHPSSRRRRRRRPAVPRAPTDPIDPLGRHQDSSPNTSNPYAAATPATRPG